jgi:hypothetical protein
MNTRFLLPLAAATMSLCLSIPLKAEPTAVWTSTPATAVLSGPGEQYYPVLKLPAGTQLEVHQELPGGWLAIRPPQGCFSLVSATAIESVDYRTGRITRDGAASRVGSALVGDYDAVHVRLHRGELVEVLDPSPDPDTHQVRIAPPAGEFRWVHESNISRTPVAATPADAASASAVDQSGGASVAVPQASASVSQEIASTDESVATEPATSAQSDPPQGEWRIREESTDPPQPASAAVAPVRYDSPSNSSPPATSPVAESTAEKSTENQPAAGLAGDEGTQSTAAGGTVTSAPASQAQLTPTFAAQLDQLEIQISRRVAGPPNLWVFDDLEREAARLASLATTKDEMATIRELGTRMSRFANIAARHRALPPQQLAGGNGAQATSASSDGVGPIPPANGYDAVGILRPVVSKRPGAPPYALVDDRGEVITFVTPSPSVNMQAYLGQRVAVSGSKAYLPEYRRRNIQTARVMPMEGTRTR